MESQLPHEGVYVRLGVSDIHGIGVFAIRKIPKGTNIFANDGVALVWVDIANLENSAPTLAHRALYEDFGIRRAGKIGCPTTFNNLTPGWYLNEPHADGEPNVEVDAHLNFMACRDIAEGEELTVRYSAFSQTDAAR